MRCWQLYEYVPTDRIDFESELNQIDLSHLTVSQKSEFCDLLRKYTLMFLVINQVTAILYNMKYIWLIILNQSLMYHIVYHWNYKQK